MHRPDSWVCGARLATGGPSASQTPMPATGDLTRLLSSGMFTALFQGSTRRLRNPTAPGSRHGRQPGSGCGAPPNDDRPARHTAVTEDEDIEIQT